MNKSSDFLTEQALWAYLDMPAHQRPLAFYDEAVLLPGQLVFSPAEVERVTELVMLGADAKHHAQALSKLLIDLSWASSHLEGNTYTYLDTQVLIEYGERNPDRPLDEAAMILNHKYAIERLLASPDVSSPERVQALHALLACDDQAPGSQHFLVPERCGLVRSFGGLEISGTSYLPPQAEDRGGGFVPSEFGRLIRGVNDLPDPINQSFLLMSRIPYLQVFYDANKRTGRLACNAPLLSAGLAPLSFVDFDKRRYLGGLLAIYELGDDRLAKSAFLDAYLSSTLRYKPLYEPATRSLLATREQSLADARAYVLGESDVLDPAWRGSSSRSEAHYDPSP